MNRSRGAPNFESRLNLLRLRIEPLERFIDLFAGSLSKPLLYDSGKSHVGFRFAKPDERHFCLLKAVRAISAFNAAVLLAQGGYTQEIAVLMRTLVECTTHIEFVLPAFPPNSETESRIKKYIEEYFADYKRGDPSDYKKAQVPQRIIHEAIAADFEALQKHLDPENAKGTDSASMMSNVYRNSSSYVHAKYPEVMDMYGGTPGRFHVRGMAFTPKDAENLEVLETYFTTVSNAIRLIVVKLDLKNLVLSDAKTADWYSTDL